MSPMRSGRNNLRRGRGGPTERACTTGAGGSAQRSLPWLFRTKLCTPCLLSGRAQQNSPSAGPPPTLPRNNSPNTGLPAAYPRKSSPNAGPPPGHPRNSSPSTPENSVFRPFWACRANFFAHRTQPRGDFETNDTTATTDAGQHETAITTARLRTATVETNNTSATEKRTKNAHFSPAKATLVSTGPPHRPAKATPVSVKARPARAQATRVSPPTRARANKGDIRFWKPHTWCACNDYGTSRHLCAHSPENSHAIRVSEVSIKSENVAIPTI